MTIHCSKQGRKVGSSYLARRKLTPLRTTVRGKTAGHCKMDQSRVRGQLHSNIGIPTFLPSYVTQDDQ